MPLPTPCTAKAVVSAAVSDGVCARRLRKLNAIAVQQLSIDMNAIAEDLRAFPLHAYKVAKLDAQTEFPVRCQGGVVPRAPALQLLAAQPPSAVYRLTAVSRLPALSQAKAYEEYKRLVATHMAPLVNLTKVSNLRSLALHRPRRSPHHISRPHVSPLPSNPSKKPVCSFRCLPPRTTRRSSPRTGRCCRASSKAPPSSAAC